MMLERAPAHSGTRSRAGNSQVAHVIISFGYGGTERVAAGLVARARARGERVRALVPSGGDAESGIAGEIALSERIRVHDPNHVNWRAALRFAVEAARYARRADVIHAHLPWPDRVGTALLCRGTTPAVLTFHALPPVLGKPKDLLFGWRMGVGNLMRASARIAPLVLVALTRFDRHRLACAFPGMRIEIVPNAPLPATGAHPGAIPFGSGIRIISVGRLEPGKGFARLLRALAAEPARSREWSLCIIGEGPQRTELEALTVQLGIAERVLLPGVLAAAHVLRQADLYVTTSESEGMSVSLLEALQAELAVVASPIPAHQEILEGIDGALLDEDCSAWPTQFAHLLDDPALRKRNAELGGARVRSAFTADAQDARYRRLYDEISRETRR